MAKVDCRVVTFEVFQFLIESDPPLLNAVALAKVVISDVTLLTFQLPRF